MARKAVVFVLGLAALVVFVGARADACGGFFCQNSPVDQAGERIVFTVNDDGTITSLIEIQYTGAAPDFSWILPIPSAIDADDLQVPDDGPDVFSALHAATDVQIIPPRDNDCGSDDSVVATSDADAGDSAEADDGGVDVFASGEVGPFQFDVIGSDDPDALITWLIDNKYRVEPFMEPLIAVYVEEQFAFTAMRLLDGEEADSIQPIEITYEGTEPMVPLRLTAVAATQNMPIWLWIFADEQAVPANYEHMTIDTRELTFGRFGGPSDYTQLVQLRADALGGRAFITEYAGPAIDVDLTNNYLRNRRDMYLTRLYTQISPGEMTVDPVFSFDADAEPVSNVRDASRLEGLVDCQRDGSGWFTLTGNDAIDPYNDDGTVAATTPGLVSNVMLSRIIVIGIVAALVVGGLVLRRRWDRPTPIPHIANPD